MAIAMKTNYLPPSPDPELLEVKSDSNNEYIVITTEFVHAADPIHLPTPTNTPQKSASSADELGAITNNDALDTKTGESTCYCNLKERNSPSPKPSSPKMPKSSKSLNSKEESNALKVKSRGRKCRKPVKLVGADLPVTQKSEIKPRGKQKTDKPEENKHQKVLTDYFPVRRSNRKPSNVLKKQYKEELKTAVLNGTEEGLEIIDIECKGRGVVAAKDFKKGDFVVEYAGDLIDLKDAKTREEKYKIDTKIGCYMYYFNFQEKAYCVDATAESGKMGRLLNHSRNGNCTTKVIGIDDRPYLLLVAATDIKQGEELLYDYGDRDKESLVSHPWLKL